MSLFVLSESCGSNNIEENEIADKAEKMGEEIDDLDVDSESSELHAILESSDDTGSRPNSRPNSSLSQSSEMQDVRYFFPIFNV